VSERAVVFGSTGPLIGILTDAAPTGRHANSAAILLLNAGLLHRVGPRRLYVHLARRLAELGHVVLRFDFSGIGDSPSSSSEPFGRSALRETREAMDWLSSELGTNRFILMGICSGAGVSFEAACSDDRVVGVALINYQIITDDDGDLVAYLEEHKNMHYYRRIAVFTRSSWLRLFTGATNYRELLRMPTMLFRHRLTGQKVAFTTEARLRLLVQRGVMVMFIFSERDPSLDLLRKPIRNLRFSDKIGLDVIPGADHLFTSPDHQEWLLHVLTARMREVPRP
jgi:pimeloyl-ACP methyl ester carboxylesterase